MPQPDLKLLPPKPLDLLNHSDAIQLHSLYQQGNTAAAHGEYLRAIESYTQILQIDCEYLEAYCARGRSQMALKCYTDAKLDYSRAIDLNPFCAISYCGLAKAYYGLREYPIAIITIDLAISIDDQNLDFYGCRAMINHKLGNREAVLVDCRIVLERQPHDRATRWLNAISHFHLGNYKIAIFNFSQYLNVRSNDFYAYYYRGICYEQLADLPQALADLSHAILILNSSNSNVTEHQAVIYRKRGRIRQHLGDLTSAMVDFDRAIKIDPTTAESYCYRADIYTSRGDYPQALIECNQAIQLLPQLVSAYYQRGVIHTEMGNLPAALVDYHKLIELNPLDINAYIQRSWIYFRHGEYPAVIQDCDRIITLEPNSIPANYLLGVVKSLSGSKQEAIINFSKVLDLQPNFICALYHRGLIYFDLQDKVSAMNDFRSAQSIQDLTTDCLSSRDESGLYAEGLALYHMGHPQTARVILQQAAVVAQKLKSVVFHHQIIFTLEALGMS